LALVPGEHALHGRLGLAIGVDGAYRRVLRYRDDIGFPVDGGAGAKDEAQDSMGDHGVEQGDGAADVVGEIAPGLAHGLPGLDVAAIVDDGVEIVGGHKAPQGLLVPHVSLDQLRGLVDGGRVASDEVVQDRYVVVGLN